MATYSDTDIIGNQKYVAGTILEKLFPIDPYSIVAGGAPRDWYLGNPAADVDVFFHVPSNAPINTVSKMLKAIGINETSCKAGHNIPNHYKMNPSLRCVFGTIVEGVNVQIMLMKEKTFKSVIPQFPLSICHAWYKNGIIHTERPFLRSIKHKAIYKTNTIYNNEHEYVKKILAKFPEYKYYSDITKLAAKLLDN